MLNNQLVTVSSTLLRNKLATAVTSLQQLINPSATNPDFQTLELAIAEGTKALSLFYKQLGDPQFLPIEARVDTPPDPNDFNDNFVNIKNDIDVIFSEFENLETVVLGEFNYLVSRLNRLNGKLKASSSQLGDYILLSSLPTKDAIFFSDAFNNTSRIEMNSPLLNADQCEIEQAEGIVSLPTTNISQSHLNITALPVINKNSNGVVGNNEEEGKSFNGTVTDILDNNSDTWFEYERVVSSLSENDVPLLLDMTINLGEPKIINFIRINPNNFGTRTQIEIVSIDTSYDGKNFISIKDDVPIADFFYEDEANVFTLAPSTSKFSGQGLYSFLPRKAKYVHLCLRQSSPYVIKAKGGSEKFRYAIGIRDVDIQAITYKSAGELISTDFAVGDEVRKVVLLSNQMPSAATPSSLASIEHFVSPDSGISWYPIRPKVSSGDANVDQTIPEVLDFNGVSDGSIITSAPINTLRYKAVMKRNKDAFTKDSSELVQDILDATELHTPPTTTPFTISLQHTPINNSLRLIDPQFGSRGKEDAKYQIATGTGEKLSILLPFKPLKKDFEKVWVEGYYWTLEEKDPEQIYVDGEEWTRGQLLTSSGLYYHLNYESGKLEFGNGYNGKAVPKDSVISMTLSEEQIFPSRGTDHIAELNYPTSNDKKQIEISLLETPATITTVLKKGQKVHQLNKNIIYDPDRNLTYQHAVFSPYNGYIVSFSSTYTTEKIFIDGSSEFSGASNEFSFDFANGLLYLSSKTDTSFDTTIHYSYYPTTVLSEDDWSFVNTSGGISNSVSISNNVFRTSTGETRRFNTGEKYGNLKHMGIVRGTLKFYTTANLTPTSLSTEVEFIDGRTELFGMINAAEEIGSLAYGTVSFVLKTTATEDTNFGITFSNKDIFIVDKTGSSISAIGDYQIVRTSTSTTVYVKTAEATDDAGSIYYYYQDAAAQLGGRYSVNYQTGEVFSYSPIELGTWAKYDYTNYRIKYDIARLVPPTDWELDISTNKITIRDREILRNIRTPQFSGGSNTKYYQASYKYVGSSREDVSELEPYFTPTLKDYTLKVMTKSRLI